MLNAFESILHRLWKFIFRLSLNFNIGADPFIEPNFVAVDVTYEFTSSKFRGIGNYSRWLLGIIQGRFSKLIFIAHVGHEVLVLRPIDQVGIQSFEIVSNYPNMDVFVNLEKIDACIFLSPFEKSIKSLRIQGTQSWIVLYDFIPLYRPWQFRTIAKYVRYVKKVFEIRFTRVLAISRKTQKDLLYLFPKHVNNLVIPIEYRPKNFLQHPSELIEKNSFLVFVSKDPRKNTLRVIKAWTSIDFSKPFKLFLVGELQLSSSLSHKLARENKSITYIPIPSPTELNQILNRCEFLIAPSLDEGLGLPLIEGALLGKKIVFSAIPSHIELVSSGGLIFNPKSTKNLISVFRSLDEGLEILPLTLRDFSREMDEFLLAL